MANRACTTADSSDQSEQLNRLLEDWSGGDEGALKKLLPLIEPELHRLAHHYMSRERAGHILQTTALVNEAYLRLAGAPRPVWHDQTHFVAAAAQLMRRIMVDHARERGSLKRGGGALWISLEQAPLANEARSEELLALDEALERLAAQDQRKSQIVELRYFGGLTAEETAEFLKLSLRTVEREWQMAKAWLHRALNIMLRHDGYVKVLDFGIAKLSQTAPETPPNEQRTTVDRAVFDSTIGTLRYMSPEQLGGGPVDQRGDIWSLGIVIHEMLSGALLLPAYELESVVGKAISKQPDDRFQQMIEMVESLKEVRRKLGKKRRDSANPATARSYLGRRSGSFDSFPHPGSSLANHSSRDVGNPEVSRLNRSSIQV